MSSERWEAVGPLVCLHALGAESFSRSAIDHAQADGLAAVEAGRRVDRPTLAKSFEGVEHAFTDHRRVPLWRHLRDTASRWLQADGERWTLSVKVREPGHEIVRWRYVTMLVPPSIMVGAASAGLDGRGPHRVQLLPDSMAPAQEVGHLHVHLGPMLPFEALWAELSHAFLLRGCLDAHAGEGIEYVRDVPTFAKIPDERHPGARWKWVLEQAFAARLWLDEPRRPGGRPPALVRGFARADVDHERSASELTRLWSDGRFRAAARRRVRHDVGARRDAERRRQRDGQRRRGHDGVDPVGPAALEAAEVAFLAQGFTRCRDDEVYARVFYQYLRTKVALYRLLVVDPWTPGLRHFLDVVQRDGPYTNVVGDRDRAHDLRLAAGRDEDPIEVGALEIHIPPQTWLRRRDRLGRDRRLGWVLSFVRAGDPRSNDPTGAEGARHWPRDSRRVGAMCRALGRLMESRPSVLFEIRAVSLMNWERNGPVWVYEGSLRRLVERSCEVARDHSRLHVQPLRTAYHLGEDFDHLLSGLRQIYEPFEWGLIGRGDRVGHALALGLVASDWCERSPWVLMRPWDRLLDLGFAYWAFENLEIALLGQVIEWLRVSAAEVLAVIFGVDDRDPLALARDVWRGLPRRATRSRGSSERGEFNRLRHARTLRDRVCDDPAVGRRALSMSLAVETKRDREMLAVVQRLVAETLAKWQIAIEVNPSSNLLIGGLRSLFEQPVFHTNELPIIFNVDDPLTFGTTLADEYAYAWAGMVLGSTTTPYQATRRLEEAARNSMRYTFTEPARNEPGGRRRSSR